MADKVKPIPDGYRSVTIVLYVEDVDMTSGKAIAAGGKVLQPVQDRFYGDRMGTFEDPSDTSGMLQRTPKACHPEEMKKRMAQQEHQD